MLLPYGQQQAARPGADTRYRRWRQAVRTQARATPIYEVFLPVAGNTGASAVVLLKQEAQTPLRAQIARKGSPKDFKIRVWFMSNV